MVLSVVSFNIKCDDTIAEVEAEQLWANRKENLIEEILDLNADLIGMQEVMPHQYDFFKKELKEYGSIYCSRDKNATNGEGCPVFYKQNKFELLKQQTFWLSDTPNISASTSWNSRWPRICTFVVLKEKDTGKKIAFFNTHLDHKSDEARTNGIKLIISKIKELDLPTILTGDFNSTKQNMAYSVANSFLKDCNEHNDNSITFHLWGHPEILQNGITNIDYVFQKGFVTKKYRVVDNDKNALKNSDHFALNCEVEL